MFFVLFCVISAVLQASSVEKFGDKSGREAMALMGIKLPSACIESLSGEECKKKLEVWLKSGDGKESMRKAGEVLKDLGSPVWNLPHQFYHSIWMLVLGKSFDKNLDLLGKAIDEKLLKGEEVDDDIKILSGLINIRKLSKECADLFARQIYLLVFLYLETSTPGVFYDLKRMGLKYGRYILTTPTENGTKLSLLVRDANSNWNVKKEAQVSGSIVDAAFDLEKEYLTSYKKELAACPAIFLNNPTRFYPLFTMKGRNLVSAQRDYDKLYVLHEIDKSDVMQKILVRHLAGDTSSIKDLSALSNHIQEYLKKPIGELYWHYLIISSSRNLGLDEKSVKRHLMRAIIKHSELNKSEKDKALDALDLFIEFGPKKERLEELKGCNPEIDAILAKLSSFNELTREQLNEIFKDAPDLKDLDEKRNAIKSIKVYKKHLEQWFVRPKLAKAYEEVIMLNGDCAQKIAWYDANRKELDQELSVFKEHPILRDFDYEKFNMKVESTDPESIYTIGSKKAIISAFLYSSNIDREKMLEYQLRNLAFNVDRFHLHFGDHVRKITITGSGSFSIISSRIFLSSLLALRETSKIQNPIPNDRLNELIALMTVFHASSSFVTDSNVNRLLIQGMKVGERLFLAGHVYRHSVSFEIKKTDDDAYDVSFFNSGDGINISHDSYGTDRWIYYKKMNMTFEQLQQANFFISKIIEGKSIGKFYFASAAKSVDLMARGDGTEKVHSVSSQKSGTCTVKSVSYLVKWFLWDPVTQSYARYDWFKTWMLYTAVTKDIIEASRKEPAKFTVDDYTKVSNEWNVPQPCQAVCKFDETKEIFSPIIRHAILRRLALAQKYTQNAATKAIGFSMIKMLDEIIKVLDKSDSQLLSCYDCIKTPTRLGKLYKYATGFFWTN